MGPRQNASAAPAHGAPDPALTSRRLLNEAPFPMLWIEVSPASGHGIDPADAPERLKTRRLIGHRPTYVYEVLAYW